MSAVLDRTAPWQTRPGWGISVDLTPGQVTRDRQTRVHQRLIGLVLLLVLLACAGVGLMARADRAGAQRGYDEEQARTGALAAEVSTYADVTAMQTTTTRVQGDLTTVLSGDVDVVNLLARVNQAVPTGVSIGNQSVVFTAPAKAAVDETTGTGTGAAATTTGAVIGTMTLSGSATQVSAVTPFVSALNKLPGAINVLPTSVTATAEGTTYTITLNLTDALLVGSAEQDQGGTS